MPHSSPTRLSSDLRPPADVGRRRGSARRRRRRRLRDWPSSRSSLALPRQHACHLRLLQFLQQPLQQLRHLRRLHDSAADEIVEVLRERADVLRRVEHEVHVADVGRSEEHTSELQSLMRISYAVFCLKKKIQYLHPDI